MKKKIMAIPILRKLVLWLNHWLIEPFKSFESSEKYWQKRYEKGGNSGAGSYAQLAEFKSEILNDFVLQKKIKGVIELGCGDGNQLQFAEYPSYIGFDISETVILQCREKFKDDPTKSFHLMSELTSHNAELVLSLDVIYHLIEDDTYIKYMNLLFTLSTQYVIIYSSNTDQQNKYQSKHVKHRKFTDWIEKKITNWKLVKHIPNKYSFNGDVNSSSIADFYIYKKVSSKNRD